MDHVESDLLTKEKANELAKVLQELQHTYQQLLILKYYMELY